MVTASALQHHTQSPAIANLFSNSHFVSLRMFYTWNHTVSNLLRLAFSLSITPLRSLNVFACINSSLLFCQIVFHGIDVPKFNHSPFEGYLGCFQLGLLWIRLLLYFILYFVYKFLNENKFSFLWDKYSKVQVLGWTISPLLVLKELPNYFSKWQYHFTFRPAIWSVSKDQFLHIQSSMWYYQHFFSLAILMEVCSNTSLLF